jgi:uncharacterized membrane protein
MVIVKEAPMAENIYTRSQAPGTSDKGYRRMLSDKRNFRDFVKSRTAAPWAEQIDADSLERIDTKHITKDFKDRDSDIVYRAKVEAGDVVFCVLLELQSEPDFTIARLSPFASFANGWKAPLENSPASAGWS